MVAKTIQQTHSQHTQAVNVARGWAGHLWQGRFFSTMLDERHLQAALIYVEQNPVRAGMVSRAEEYPWSSAACHCGVREDRVLAGNAAWSGKLDDWGELLHRELGKEGMDELRACTNTGKPYGDEKFVQEMSKAIGRPLERRPRGRPRLSSDTTVNGL